MVEPDAKDIAYYAHTQLRFCMLANMAQGSTKCKYSQLVSIYTFAIPLACTYTFRMCFSKYAFAHASHIFFMKFHLVMSFRSFIACVIACVIAVNHLQIDAFA